MYSGFSFCNCFPREPGDALTQPMGVNALERRALVAAFSNKFASRTTAHVCAQMSVSVSTQCGRSLAPRLPGRAQAEQVLLVQQTATRERHGYGPATRGAER